ncbi:MAG: signal recognition particle-docking protein FtsY [Lachnospiraceae bacterium]|nr:signal recognition particle-docking protein FtsY [Lachnospiraceae bacterium]
MGFFSKLTSFFTGYKEIDAEFYEELEEQLVMGDVGIAATEELIEELKDKVKANKISEPEKCRELLMTGMKEALRIQDPGVLYDFEQGPSIVLFVGVNGVGKTTTVGKLAKIYKDQGKKVLLSAADTFRAAAIEQLEVWSERAGVDIIKGREGGDPGAVIFDSVKAAKARNTDLLLCDTAGRLHNKSNLMNELKKINTIIKSEYPEAKKETLVVVDATTGQNAMNQTREFMACTDVTGIVLTKLDGSAKGGIAIAIEKELKVPVKFVGMGEGITDLKRFDPDSFVDSLFT